MKVLRLCLNAEGKETSVGIHCIVTVMIYVFMHIHAIYLKTKVYVYIRLVQTIAKMQLYTNISALDLAKIICFAYIPCSLSSNSKFDVYKMNCKL